ncbi:MAG TPA: cytochrome c biogenesis protein CcsA [Armatimonadota bacterium]|nr:cytochrome c biogenesis protein CcsA [Armatimonadota bacterium]
MSLIALALLTITVMSAHPSTMYGQEYHAPASAPWWYRLAAVWAGQAGGLLLWCLETAIISMALHPKRHPRAIAVLFLLQGCLLALTLSNMPFAPAQVSQGGINPLLLHPMMLIHPPMLFLGYALLSVPFALTLAGLLQNTPERWRDEVRPWVLISWLALTAGNGFGAIWAYKSFGWGGFWSWDPVENTSFVPWMLATATIHGLYLSRSNHRWFRPTTICALAGFISVLYGSFLARSGMLGNASVHAYTRGESLYLWALGGLLLLAVLGACILLGIRWRNWAISQHPDTATSWAPATSWGAIMFIGIAILVLIGMSLPIFGVIPATEVYNTVLLPTTLAMLVALAWPQLKHLLKTPTRIAWFALCAGICFIIAAVFVFTGFPRGLGVISVLIQGLCAPTALTVAVITTFLSFRQIIRKKRQQPIPAALAHTGVSLLLIGTFLSGFGTQSEQGFIPVGKTVHIAGQALTILHIHQSAPTSATAELDMQAHTGMVSITQDTHFNTDLRRVWINAFWWGDAYIVPLVILPEATRINDQDIPAGVMVEVSAKPGMRLVWWGIWCIAIGIFLAILHRRRAMLPANNQETIVKNLSTAIFG